MTSSDFSGQYEVARYYYPENVAAFLAVSSKFAVLCFGGNSLALYKFSNKAKTTKDLGVEPQMLRFDADENLLVTFSNCIRKYSVDDRGELTRIRTCDGVVQSGGIAFTNCGDIGTELKRETIHCIPSRLSC